jgi:hypothetical protein
MNIPEVNQDATFNSLIDNDDDSIIINTVSLLSCIDVLGVDSNTNGPCGNQHECCGHTAEKKRCLILLLAVADYQSAVPFSSPVELSVPIESNVPTLPETKRKRAPRKRNEVKHKKTNNASHTVNVFENSDNDNGYEEVVKVFKIERDGMASCHVVYLPRRLLKKHGANKFDSLFLCVIDDLRSSPNSADRARSHHNHCMVTCDIIKKNIIQLKNHLEVILESVLPPSPTVYPILTPK